MAQEIDFVISAVQVRGSQWQTVSEWVQYATVNFDEQAAVHSVLRGMVTHNGDFFLAEPRQVIIGKLQLLAQTNNAQRFAVQRRPLSWREVLLTDKLISNEEPRRGPAFLFEIDAHTRFYCVATLNVVEGILNRLDQIAAFHDDGIKAKLLAMLTQEQYLDNPLVTWQVRTSHLKSSKSKITLEAWLKQQKAD